MGPSLRSSPPRLQVAIELLQLQALTIERAVHEIRGLLISGNYAKLLAEERAGPMTPLQKQYAVTIVENTHRIKEVLTLLSHSLESGDSQARCFSLRTLLEECYGTTFANNARCAFLVRGNRNKLREAMLDVLVFANSSFGSDVELWEENGCALITFRTLHQGNAQRMAPEMHNPIHMSDRHEYRKLKLECSRGIVRLHGGSLVVDETDPLAEKVSIRLPLVVDDAAQIGGEHV
jgi:signal transduction histidine kinase